MTTLAHARRALTAALLTLCAASSAHAQELGQAGNLALSIERVFGFYVDNQTVDLGPVDAEADYTDLSLGWNHPPSPLTAPRLGVDYFLNENLTLGGSFGVFSLNEDTAAGGTDVTGILFAARMGYALRLGHSFSFWPRGGFTYTNINADVNAADRNLLALTLEGMFTMSPADGWAVLAGPIIDIGITGEAADNDLSETCFGVMFGLLGYFGT
jgi:Outer membrane protein beta-barrel domain